MKQLYQAKTAGRLTPKFLTLLMILAGCVLAGAAHAATPATTPAARQLPPGPWAASWCGGSGKYVTTSLPVAPWLGDDQIIQQGLDYAAKQTAAGRPVVLSLVDPLQWVNKGNQTLDQFVASREAWFSAWAAKGVHIDLLSIDAEPWDDRLTAGLIAPYLRHYPGGLWCNYWTSVIPAAAVTPKPGQLAPLLRRFGAANAADDVQPSVGESVNAPACALWTGGGVAAQTRMGRIGESINRCRATLIGDPHTPVVPWLASLTGCDTGTTREDCRDLDLLQMPLSGGRALLFDESNASKPTAGADAVADYDAMAGKWLAALAGRHWAKALPGTTYCGINDSYIVSACELDTGERLFVVTARDKFAKPLPVAKDHDGYQCIVQPPTDGMRTAIAVFKAASH